MVKTYVKGSNTELSENFTSNDFDCKCTRPACDSTLVSEELVQALEVLRKIAGRFEINSGYRCQVHNAEIGGVTNSFHIRGMASDIESIVALNGRMLAQDAESVSAFQAGGIGVATDWIHVDVRGYKARWTYPLTKC